MIQYIEVTLSDIETANRLCSELLGRGSDELPPQTKKLLSILCDLVKEEAGKAAVNACDYRFTRKQLRQYSGWSDFQVQTHMQKLAALEYVVIHRGGRGQTFVYELSSDAADGSQFKPMAQSFEHEKGHFEGCSSLGVDREQSQGFPNEISGLVQKETPLHGNAGKTA